MAYVTLTLTAILAILLGVLVLLVPKFLRYAVGIYLIVIGIIQLLDLNAII